MKDLIQNKLESYEAKTSEDEENALKEITQEVALYSFYKCGFFEKAAFQGGTCLRIVHGVPRFSEDLDFVLQKPNVNFDFQTYLDSVSKTLSEYGYNIEVVGSDKADKNVRMRFLKDDSIKKVVNLRHHADLEKKIKIKVELDTNPPLGANCSQEFLDFPVDFTITVHDLPSLFAGKCHALLCRDYAKGRDWFDFSWYVSQKIVPNFKLLTSAIDQIGPWKGQGVKAEMNWLKEQLNLRISEIVWEEAKKDVDRFLRSEQRESVKLWGVPFFRKKVEKL